MTTIFMKGLGSMVSYFFKIAFRKITRDKTFSVLNILGLSVGITCFMLIGLLVHYELTFDDFHKNGQHIYRVYTISDSPLGQIKSARTPDPLPKCLKNDFPQLDHVIRFSDREVTSSVDTRKFMLHLMSTDAEIFEVFTFPFLYGTASNALKDPYSIVLSYETSIKLFGSQNPVGKTISILNDKEFQVTGVLKKLPSNSTIQFDVLVPVRYRQIIDPEYENRWHSSGTFTFIHCQDQNEIDQLAAQLQKLLEKYQPDYLQGRNQLAIEKLRDIHICKHSINEMVPTVSPNYIILLMAIGLVILLTACFNYTNLTISGYADRLKEIGVRKIMGADRKRLIWQFMGETLLIAVGATMLGVILTELFLPKFNLLVEKQLHFPVFDWPVYVALVIGLGLMVGLISGIYPAFFLSSINAVHLMKQHTSAKPRSKHTLSRVLLMSQFSIASTLIISMLLVYVQIRYMKNYDLGFDPENIIAFPTNYYEIMHADEKIESWKNYIDQNGKSHGVLNASVSEHIPGYYFNNAFGVMKASADHGDFEVMIVTSVDSEAGEVYHVKLKSGRFFSDSIESDKGQAVLINETAADKFGFLDPIGEVIKFRHGEGPFTIIGVLEDIHFRSLQHQVEPVVYRHASYWKSQFIATKINPAMKKEAIGFLSEANDIFGLEDSFDYFFVEDRYGNSYQTETRILEIIGIFAGLAILLSCLGLFGLTGISLAQRIKEIGIRKVLGASVTELLALLTTSYIKPVLLASLVAWPISYVAVSRWLQNYPYKINLGLHWMAIGSGLVLLIAVLVIFYHASLVARNNPIHALRDE